MSWDHDVKLTVYVRVVAGPNDEYFEGWGERLPEHGAVQALAQADVDLARQDGFADLIGSAWVTHIEVDDVEEHP